jgi:hypothetical protein
MDGLSAAGQALHEPPDTCAARAEATLGSSLVADSAMARCLLQEPTLYVAQGEYRSAAGGLPVDQSSFPHSYSAKAI